MDNFERYNRNMQLKSFDLAAQKKINEAKVLVCGLGGLGSGLLSNLACIGVENIGLLDFDKVDITNLNRQFIHSEKNIGTSKTQSAIEWINNFNSRINLIAFNEYFCAENAEQILKDFDYVVDCFDNWTSKFLLNEMCVKYNKILIHSGVENDYGQVMKIVPNETCCLSCIFSEEKEVLTEKGILSPIINIISSIAAMEIIKTILGHNENSLENVILTYNISSNELKKIKVKKNFQCKICSTNN